MRQFAAIDNSFHQLLASYFFSLTSFVISIYLINTDEIKCSPEVSIMSVFGSLPVLFKDFKEGFLL
jgi:hypothetical protein